MSSKNAADKKAAKEAIAKIILAMAVGFANAMTPGNVVVNLVKSDIGKGIERMSEGAKIACDLSKNLSE